MNRLLACAFALSSALPLASAQVRILGGDPAGFPTLQGAIDAASHGDTILIPPGSYGESSITGKAVSLAAENPGLRPKIAGLDIHSVPSNGLVVLSTLSLVPDLYTTRVALELEGVDSPVRIVDCDLKGADGVDGIYYYNPGWHALSVEDCPDVALAGCSIIGGDGSGDESGLDDDCFGGDAGDAINAVASHLLIQDSSLRGGHGGHCANIGGDGGHGVRILRGSLQIQGTGTTGGDGGGGCYSWTQGGQGGSGLRVRFSSTAECFDTHASGGAGGHVPHPSLPGREGRPGPPTGGPGELNQIPGQFRTYDTPTLATGGSMVLVRVQGTPEDESSWGFSRWTRLEPLGARGHSAVGTWTLMGPSAMPPTPFGTVPAGGFLDVNVPVPNLPPSSSGAWIFSQGWSLPTTGSPTLGTARPLLLLPN